MPATFWLGTSAYIASLLRKRKGEIKLGERIQFLASDKNIPIAIRQCKAPFVLLGLPEDMGVYANYGKRGSRQSLETILQYFCNMQHQRLHQGSDILFLGRIGFETSDYDFIQKADLNLAKKLKKARAAVESLDKLVAHYTAIVAQAGKKLIVVGGGHNNCYGLIKGVALGKNQAIDAVNIDAHADFRTLEGRHSGNGFSYAFHEGFLKRYTAIGLHESYIDPHALQAFEQNQDLEYISFEEVFLRKQRSLKKAVQSTINTHQNAPLGLELDMDAVQNYPSSAMSSEGFHPREIRHMVYQIKDQCEVVYLHICESSLLKKRELHFGKLVALLISDFIRREA
ncbi:MAG: arginase family protein [Flavobacteriaceae bacterium]|nr:arginase family protein [Flavobacteriaceae bacterium]